MNSLIESCGGREKLEIIYVGDGSGDFCPSSQLVSGDIICCRDGWALHSKLLECNNSLRAQIRPWRNGADLFHEFEEIFRGGK